MLYVFVFFLGVLGCEQKEDEVLSNVPTVPDEVDAADCIPADECCMICSAESQACGDACISADVNCNTDPGCACEEADLCSD